MRWPEDYSGATSDDHLVQLWLAGRPDSTKEKYQQVSRDFLLYLCPTGIQALTVADLVRWAESLEGADATKTRVVATVKSLLAFAHRTGYTAVNVGVTLRCPKIVNKLHQRIADEETVQEILAQARTPRDKALVRLFYGSGFRSGEVCRLTFGDIRGNRVTVQGKGAKSRTILLPGQVVQLLTGLRRKGDSDATPIFRSAYGKPLSPVVMWKIVRKIADEAGHHFSPHWFRHAHASHALDRGCPIQVVQKNLGHANVATTSCYLHVKPTQGSGEFLNV